MIVTHQIQKQMKKSRDILTLLLILEANVHRINEEDNLAIGWNEGRGGLCYLTHLLRLEGKIYNNEEDLLDEYVEDEGPSSLFNYFKWPRGDVKLRRKWLKDRIEIERIRLS